MSHDTCGSALRRAARQQSVDAANRSVRGILLCDGYQPAAAGCNVTERVCSRFLHGTRPSRPESPPVQMARRACACSPLRAELSVWPDVAAITLFEVGPESMNQGGYPLVSASRSIGRLVHTAPPVFGGSVWIPSQQVNVKVGHVRADHRRVHVLGAGHASKGSAGTSGP